MSTVSLVQRGLIYENEFTSPYLDSKWEVLPNDPSRYTMEGDSLRLHHGDTPLYVFFKELTNIKQFVLDVKNTYNPLEEGDVGGLIVYGDTENIIHIEEYLDTSLPTPEPRTYPWVRLIRDYNVYSAYWSEDGNVWSLLGVRSLGLDSPKIGLFLEGGGGQPLDVEYVRISRNQYITVDNLMYGTLARLHDNAGNLVQERYVDYGETSVKFDIQHIGYKFDGFIGVKLPDGNEFTPLPGYGSRYTMGDLLYFELLVDMYYIEVDNTKEPPVLTEIQLTPNLERFLGYIQSGDQPVQEIRMIAKSPFLTGKFKDVKFELFSYGDVDSLDKVDIAPDLGEWVPGTYSKSIMAYEITNNDPYTFIVRLEREDSFDRYASQVRFGIRVSSTYA